MIQVQPGRHVLQVAQTANAHLLTLGHMIECEVEVGGQLLSPLENDPRRDVIHSEGQPVRVRFLENCLYILLK